MGRITVSTRKLERGAKGCGCGEGVPFPTRSFFKTSELNMASFGAFLELILLQLNCLSYTHKSVSLDFGIIARHLCQKVGDIYMTVPGLECISPCPRVLALPADIHSVLCKTSL